MYSISELQQKVKNKKFLITGHTGFKGAYLIYFLKYLGAKVYGYALEPEDGSLYIVADIKLLMESELIGDIRDFDKLKTYIVEVNPDYIIHMAAQPIVLKSYEEPKYTYETNVIGTVNLFEAIRQFAFDNNIYKKTSCNIKSVLNVTTDKVYENNDLDDYAFKENEKLCGYDPYSNSKSCSELVTYSYKHSFFSNSEISISTARAGNVIGGGDVCENRIIPDCVRDTLANREIVIRNPYSIRPYQYVLEPLIVYLNIVLMTAENKNLSGSYNIGPDKESCVNTLTLAETFVNSWNNNEKTNFAKIAPFGDLNKSALHEAKFLRLDNSLVKETFNYKPILSIQDALELTVKTYKVIKDGNMTNIINNLNETIEIFLNKMNK